MPWVKFGFLICILMKQTSFLMAFGSLMEAKRTGAEALRTWRSSEGEVAPFTPGTTNVKRYDKEFCSGSCESYETNKIQILILTCRARPFRSAFHNVRRHLFFCIGNWGTFIYENVSSLITFLLQSILHGQIYLRSGISIQYNTVQNLFYESEFLQRAHPPSSGL